MIYLACTFLACIDNMMTITGKIACKNYALFVFVNYAMYLIKECNKQGIVLELKKTQSDCILYSFEILRRCRLQRKQLGLIILKTKQAFLNKDKVVLKPQQKFFTIFEIFLPNLKCMKNLESFSSNRIVARNKSIPM